MFDEVATDLLTQVVRWSTFAALIAATSILGWTGWLRLQRKFIGVHETRFIARWRPILLETVDAVPARLPRVKKPDWFVFLALWNQFHDSLKGPAHHRLKAVALRLRMDFAARALLNTSDMEDKLVAVMTLGHLRDLDSWNILEEIARSRTPVLSLAALRSLFLIDPARASAILLSSLGARNDWPTEQLKTILAESAAPEVTQGLIQSAEIAIPSELPRLIALMDSAEPEMVKPFLRRTLTTSKDEEVLVACLKSRHVPRELGLLTPFMKNDSWEIRTQIARVLGATITQGQEQLLISMLSDEVWWVRYRAGQSLAHLPFYSRDEMWRLRFLLTDAFAQDILDQVVAEMGLKKSRGRLPSRDPGGPG